VGGGTKDADADLAEIAVDVRADGPGVSRIVSGTHDPLIDDNHVFSPKLQEAGCRLVEHFVRDGMRHGYYFFPGLFKQGDEAFDAIRSFLARTVGAL
jgi:acetyl esterase/lipase